MKRCPTEVAEGVYRLGTRWANFYLVLDAGEGLLVDAGYPGYFDRLQQAAESLGVPLHAIAAVLVTHHHVDHAGTADAVRARAGAAVLVHERDAAKVRGDQPSHPPSGFYGQAWRLSMIRYLAHTVRVGGARYRPVEKLQTLVGARTLDLPGSPRVVPTPGHTAGHCSVLLESRGVLFAGDALVNFDYATGTAGVGLHRFNEDRQAARASLGELAALEAETVLFGHGDPWTRGLGGAVTAARERT